MDESASPLALGDVLSPRIIASPSKKIIDQRYALTHNCPALNQLFDSKTICQLIDGMIMHAPYLGDLMRMMPDFLLTCLITPPDQCFTDVLARLDDACAQARGDDAIMMALRLAKKQSALLIAMADIGGVWPLQKVTQALSDFADHAVQNAVAYLMRQAQAEGKFLDRTQDFDINQCGFVVLAMGKHGAHELNYSSDIDLIVLYDPQRAQTYLKGEVAPFFVRLTQAMVRLLQERTADGYVLRVDLRLRPDPGSTAVAISFHAACDYYELLGQNWERAAMIKARAVAGDCRAGEDFLRLLAPFIWRKYFDYAAIADIHAMKRQIHAVRGHETIKVIDHDIKLGRGGIREIEFFVQTQQLIFGGRRTSLRGAKTLDMLPALHEEGWITKAACDELTKAYIELRRIEHRLQMIRDEQTQRLPSDTKQLLSLAQFCGFRTSAAFTRHMLKIFNCVEYHYARLFESAPTLDSQQGSLVFTGVVDDPETLSTLNKMGFHDAAQAIETVRGWHFGRHTALQSARAREVMTELVPLLLQSFSESGDPDVALRAFDAALSHMPAAVELLSILKSNKKVRDLFSDMLGGAPRLTEIIASRPHVLDAAIDPLYHDHQHDQQRYRDRLKLILNTHQQFEDRLDGFRDLRHEESFLISFRILTESLTPHEGGQLFSALAAELINASFEAVTAEFQSEYGVLEGGSCAIIGMGKLGSQEMTAHSDLDLVCVYDYADAEQSSQGGRRSLLPIPYYTRLTQRLITALTAATKRGVLYEVDMRLRPSGRQGPVASQYKSFIDYYRSQAEFWEHMALTRASMVAGDAQLCQLLRNDIDAILAQQRDQHELVVNIRHMKQLIEDEKSQHELWDLKVAAGGLMDIEFVAQMLVLAFAYQHKELLSASPRAILATALSHHIISQDQYDVLVAGYDMMSALQQITHLALREKFDPAQCASSVLKHISALLHFPDFKSLECAVRDQKSEVRKVFLQVLR